MLVYHFLPVISSRRFVLLSLICTLLVSTASAQVYILNVGEEGVSRQEFDHEVVNVDSLLVDREAWINDSIQLAADSIARAEAAYRQYVLDSLVLVAREQDAAASRRSTLLRLWQRQHPMRVSRLGCALPEDTVLAEDPRVDSLLRTIDDLHPDYLLQLGQPTFRMPLVPERYIPYQRTYQRDPWQGPGQRIRRQYDYSNERLAQTYEFYSQHLPRAHVLRSDIDIPTERMVFSTESGLAGLKLDVDQAQTLHVTTLAKSNVTADKWHRKGNSSFQMSQTALTDNWYKGGDNNMSLASDNKWVLSRYDKDMKTTFETTFRLQLSGYYTKADTVHQMRVSDNVFRIDINYGYKAWKNWYYSSTTYAKTPLFDYYNTNSHVVKNTLLSPLECNVSTGMEYKKTWNNKKSSYSLLLAPLSYNLTYVHDDRVNETSFGVEAGKCSNNQFGASVTSKLEWMITKDISLSSRLYYFTDYSSIQAECENTFNFAMTRHFSARVYFYPRFDDKKDDKVQMKEMLTFGFSTIW